MIKFSNINREATLLALRRSFIPVIGIGIALTAYVFIALADTRDRVLQQTAEDTALRAADFFGIHVPGMVAALESRELDPEQVVAINQARHLGAVFHFKLFASDGGLLFESSSLARTGPVPMVDPTPMEVIISGASTITLHDQATFQGGPDTFAEAYVPVRNDDGRIVGVIEVYVDQTNLAATLFQGFRQVLIALPLLFALVYLLPALGFVVMTAHKRDGDRRLKQARFDPLTGALNRRALEEEAGGHFGREKAPANDSGVGVMFIDLDKFKPVNDTLGHAAGDAYLRYVADVIRSKTRSHDIFARYGGDEFILIMPDAGALIVRERAEQIRVAVTRPFLFKDATIQGSVSIGIAQARRTDSFQSALSHADRALYAAKADGRNRVSLYDVTSKSPPPPAKKAAA